MESAFAWLGDFINWLVQFVPQYKVVITTQGAVKFKSFQFRDPFRGGITVQTCQPGFLVYWPFVTDITVYPTARQGNDLRSQTLVTKDDRSVTVGAMIIYEIHDLEAIVAHTYDPEETIMDIAVTAVHEVCCKRTWDELLDGQRRSTLDTALRNETQRQLNDYGVKVLKVALTDMAPTRVYRLIQSQGKD